MNFKYILPIFLFLEACKTLPPKETGDFKSVELVELIKLDTSFHLDIKYATENNFAKKQVYKQARAFLQKPAAVALVRANNKLKKLGYGIIVFDGYRPWSVTNTFWKIATKEQQKIGFVADPKRGSKHNRGCAVDISLYELKTGNEVEMPSAYDEFSERAFSNYKGGTAEAKQLRNILAQIMAEEGFKVIDEEWWHFDFREWKSYPLINVPFEKL